MALIRCPECGREVSSKASLCPNCGYPISEYAFEAELSANIMKVIDNEIAHPKEEKKEFNGVYRQTLFHGLQEVYCPRCKSENCSHHTEYKTIPAKTKARYSLNLNPLRPFTLVNKKEKVVRREEQVETTHFICNKCGYKFN